MVPRPTPTPSLMTPLLGVMLWALTTGCGSGAASAPSAQVRDSAGVTIVENADVLPQGEGGWRVGGEPEVVIGTAGNDLTQALYGVSGATRLSDGRIAIGDDGSKEIRIFSPQGAFQRAWGREGGGPGEFAALELVGILPGDTLVVVDPQRRRYVLVHPDAGILQSMAMESDQESMFDPSGIFDTGELVVSHGVPPQPLSDVGTLRIPILFRSVDRNGNRVAEFGTFPGMALNYTTVGLGPNIFPVTAVYAVGPDHFFFADTERWEIRMWTPDGRLDRLIRLDREREATSEEDREAHIAAVWKGVPDNRARTLVPNLRRAKLPDRLPALMRLAPDPGGGVWVREYRAGGLLLPRSFLIFDAQGFLSGRVTLPPGSRILEIGEDYVLDLFTDELNVEYVRLLPLTRPAPASPQPPPAPQPGSVP